MYLQLLGPPKVVVRTRDTEDELPGPRLTRAWLLLLRVASMGATKRAEMAALLWDAVDDRQDGLNSIATAARKALGPASPALISRSQFKLSTDELPRRVSLHVDFNDFLHANAAGDADTAEQTLRLYGGPLLEGIVFDQAGEQWLDGERDRLKRQLDRLLNALFPDSSPLDREELSRACERGEVMDVIAAARERRSSPPRRAMFLPAPATSDPIGVIAPVSAWPTPFYTNLIKGIRNAAEREAPQVRKRLIVADVARDDVSEVDAVLANLIDRQVCGLITLNLSLSELLRARLRDLGRRVVSIMFEDPVPPVCCSIVSDHRAFAELVRHVLASYPCSLAILVTLPLLNPLKRNVVDVARNAKRDVFVSCARACGLEPALAVSLEEAATAKLTPGYAHIVEIPSYEANLGSRLFERIGDKLPPDTMLVFLDDCQAADFIVACSRSGRSAIQRRLRISAYEDTDAARWHEVSTIDPQLDRIGRLAYARLQESLDDPTFPYRTEYVPAVSRLRRSTEWV